MFFSVCTICGKHCRFYPSLHIRHEHVTNKVLLSWILTQSADVFLFIRFFSVCISFSVCASPQAGRWDALHQQRRFDPAALVTECPLAPPPSDWQAVQPRTPTPSTPPPSCGDLLCSMSPPGRMNYLSPPSISRLQIMRRGKREFNTAASTSPPNREGC